jgi:transcriptional regulator with XRE-family HTH domain
MPNFSNRLRLLRKNKEMTQEKLGEVVGKTKNNISQYERNARQADDETKIQFAKFFDVSMDYLVGLTDDPTPVSKLCNFVDVDKELDRFIDNVEKLEGLRFGNRPMLDKTKLIITKSLRHTSDIAQESIRENK